MEIVKNKDGPLGFKEKIYVEGQTQTKTLSRKCDARDWKRHRKLETHKNTAFGIEGLKDSISFCEMFDLWMRMKIRPIRSMKTIADYNCVGRKHQRKDKGGSPFSALRVFEPREMTN